MADDWFNNIKYELIIGSGDNVFRTSTASIEFNVQKNSVSGPNQATISIKNVSQETAAQLSSLNLKTALNARNNISGLPITLLAGFENYLGIIFEGNAYSVLGQQVRYGDGRETTLQIQAQDGELVNIEVLNTTLASKYSDLDLLNTVIQNKDFNEIKEVNIDQDLVNRLKSKKHKTGKTIKGKAKDVLNNLASEYDANWYVVDRVFYFRDLGVPQDNIEVTLTESNIIDATQDTVFVQPGLSVRTFLNPQIRLGQTIRINTRFVNVDAQSVFINSPLLYDARSPNGKYIVYQLNHIGANYSNEWITEVKCTAQTVSP